MWVLLARFGLLLFDLRRGGGLYEYGVYGFDRSEIAAEGSPIFIAFSIG